MSKTEVFGSGARRRIFYVDDDQALTQLVVRALGREGYGVIAETDAARALERFVATPEAFDAVVSDMEMPVLSGLELARRLLLARPAVPILLLSGWVSVQIIEQARALGVRAVVEKAGTIEELCRNLCEHLRAD